MSGAARNDDRAMSAGAKYFCDIVLAPLPNPCYVTIICELSAEATAGEKPKEVASEEGNRDSTGPARFLKCDYIPPEEHAVFE
jgi:hypothetical protein